MGVIERRRRERDVRRELAIDAAMRIYEEEGYHAITMEKIAERAELSRAALYLYFKNKDEIVISAIVPHADYFARVLQKVYDSERALRKNCWKSYGNAFRGSMKKTRWFLQRGSSFTRARQ